MLEFFIASNRYEVYENFEEARGVVIKGLDVIKVGEYFRFSNGYYAPLLLRENMMKTIKGSKILFTRFNFPQFHLIIPSTCYNRQYKYKPRDKNAVVGLKPPDFAFIELVSGGMDVFEAGKRAFKKADQKIVMGKLANAELMGKLIMRTNMKTIGEHLTKNGVNEETIAKTIADIISDPESNATLKKWALEISMKLLGDTAQKKETGSSALMEASNALSSVVNN